MVQHTTPEVRARMVALYNNGLLYSEIADAVCFSTFTVRKAIEEAGCPRRYGARPTGSVWHEAFDTLTPEALYWAGFLLTDGCIVDGCRVKLSLATADRDGVEGLKAFTKASHNLIQRNNATTLRFTSRYMVRRLGELGITPRKSLTARAHEDLVKSVDFWRGCIDGDGGVHTYRRGPLVLFTSASRAFIDQADTFFRPLTLDGDRAPTSRNADTLFDLRFNGADAVRVVRHLYPPGCITLASMRAAADEVLAYHFPKAWAQARADKP